jgi:UDP-glucose 6-dehydrogenase
MGSLSEWTAKQFDPALSWDDVAWIKKRWGGKVILKGIQDAEDARLAVDSGADALIVCTEWNEFRTPDFERIGSLMRERVLFDGRNLYDALKMSEMCSHYESIGR